MKYLIPVLFLISFAMPMPAHAAGKADMSCVKGDCKKTDPAKEAEKEMNKAAGGETSADIPIEAPVESAAPLTPKPVTPMQAADAIKEIEQAIEKETVQKSISPRTGSGSVALSPSTQSPSCAPFAQQQTAVREKITGFAEQHQIEQKIISDKIMEGVMLHKAEQSRISQLIADGVTEHKAQQPIESAKSTDYQRQLREEGVAFNEKLAANVLQHQQEQPPLRCLTEEQFANFRQVK